MEGINFAGVIIDALIFFTWFMRIAIFARAIMSWIRPSNDNVIVKFIYGITEPLLAPIRNLINKSPLGGSGMPVDLSPVIALLLLFVVGAVLSSL